MDQVDWNQFRAFLVTAEAGSLSAAARKLGLTQPTLSRQVLAMEQQLGVTLFERTGRSLVLTSTGVALLEHVRKMGTAADALCLAASGRSETIEGVVTVSASEAYAAFVLPEFVQRMRLTDPGITLELVSSNALSDLLKREADIAIRHVKPEHPDLIAKLLCTTHACFYASRSWVEAYGHPRAAQDAAYLPFVGSDRSGQFLGHLQSHGLPVKESNFSCYALHSTAHWSLVRHGMGIGTMLIEIAEKTPDIVRVLDDVPPIPIPIWLVTHRELRTSKRIRAVFEGLAQSLPIND